MCMTNEKKEKIKNIFESRGFLVADKVLTVSSSIAKRVSGILGTIILIILLSSLFFAIIFAFYVKTCLTPDFEVSLNDYKLNESSKIYYADESGNWQVLATLTGTENRIWVDYDQIPEYMEKAVVAIEDKRFYDHKGVDWYRTSGAFFQMFATMQNSYGGSTITQQLIKNLTGEDEVTVQRKLTEIFGALELEKKYDKKELMEWYLNAVYFGEGCYGVQTAAHTYFGKNVSELSLAECASIAGITNLPTYYDPFYNLDNNKKRQETILREMYNQEFITYEEYKSACAEELVFNHSAQNQSTQQIYSYYVETVVQDIIDDLKETKGISDNAARNLVFSGGYNIYTFYQPEVQASVDNVYNNRDSLRYTSGSQQIQSSIVVMDPSNGAIVALSGGMGEKVINFGLNRATGTQRPAGSSLKPLASYGPATELGYITPTTIVYDSPNIKLKGSEWYPKNDGGGNFGVVTIYQALQYSLNTVAAQIVDVIGPETSYNYLINKLGVTSLVPDDCSYAPMALGQLTNGITVREMAAAYCAFANDGIFTQSRTYSLVTDKDGNTVLENPAETIKAFSENTAHVMTFMLKNAVDSGTGTEAKISSMPVAGKTGTTTDAKDRWFVGYTPYYVAAVWTGFDTPAVISASGNPAAQLWYKVMQPIHANLEYKSFTYPYIGENTGVFELYHDELGEITSNNSDDQIYSDNISQNGYLIDESSGGLVIVPNTNVIEVETEEEQNQGTTQDTNYSDINSSTGDFVVVG